MRKRKIATILSDDAELDGKIIRLGGQVRE
jgi:hypothetical protein